MWWSADVGLRLRMGPGTDGRRGPVGRPRRDRCRGPSEPPPGGGFVLLEAVVALAIIAMAAVALLATTGTQLRTAAKADELLVAQSLAEDRLAAVRMLDYDELADLPDSLLAGRFPPPFEAFAWTASVAAMEDEYDLFGVEVVVTGPAEAFPVRTLVHRPRPVLAGGEGGR